MLEEEAEEGADSAGNGGDCISYDGGALAAPPKVVVFGRTSSEPSPEGRPTSPSSSRARRRRRHPQAPEAHPLFSPRPQDMPPLSYELRKRLEEAQRSGPPFLLSRAPVQPARVADVVGPATPRVDYVTLNKTGGRPYEREAVHPRFDGDGFNLDTRTANA